MGPITLRLPCTLTTLGLYSGPGATSTVLRVPTDTHLPLER